MLHLQWILLHLQCIVIHLQCIVLHLPCIGAVHYIYSTISLILISCPMIGDWSQGLILVDSLLWIVKTTPKCWRYVPNKFNKVWSIKHVNWLKHGWWLGSYSNHLFYHINISVNRCVSVLIGWQQYPLPYVNINSKWEDGADYKTATRGKSCRSYSHRLGSSVPSFLLCCFIVASQHFSLL